MTRSIGGAFRRLKGYLLFAEGFLRDTFGTLTGRRPELTPPFSYARYVGKGDFHVVGQEFLGHLKTLLGVQPHHAVLDVGSGIGRIAVALTGYLSPQGSYEGFDIVPVGVEWCQEKITPRFPNFRFQLADVYNKYYHPEGKYQASEYKFPFDSQTFDVVILTSVFTHMLREDVEHYLGEIARVLKEDGKVFMTFFILNEETVRAIEQGSTEIPFGPDNEGQRLQSEEFPEMAVGFDDTVMREMVEGSNLKIEGIHHGTWRGTEGTSFQDIVIARKTPANIA